MSFYVLAVDGRIKRYPYTLTDLRRDNPAIDFPRDISDELAAQYYTYPVVDTPQPSFDPDTQYIVWENPVYENNTWMQVWGVADYTPEELAERILAWRQTATCTPFQGRIALANANLMPQIEAMMNDSSTPYETKTAWEYALVWNRTSPLIESLGAALSLTPQQIDDLFRAAALIEV